MTLTLDDYIDSLGVLVPGPHPMTYAELETARTKAVEKAMIRHSRYFPLWIAQDIPGNGNNDDYLISAYGDNDNIPVFTHWKPEFSRVLMVEYPVNSYPAPDILDPEAWMVLKKPDGEYFRITMYTVQTDEVFRVSYSTLHTCTIAGCTVDDVHAEALQALAGFYYCQILSARYALTGNATISADSVDHGSKFQNFTDLGKRLEKEYLIHFGIQEGKTKPACVIADQDVPDSRGYDRLTHPARYR
jgi:hypothetical protein